MSNPNLQSELSIARERFEKEVPQISTCCGAGFIFESDFCFKCEEHSEAEYEIPFEDWLELQRDEYEEYKDSEVQELINNK